MRRHHFAAGLIALMATAPMAHAGDSATIVERGSNNYASMVIHHDGGRMRMTTTIRAGASGTASTRFTMGSREPRATGANSAAVTQQGAGNAANAVQQGKGNVAGIWQTGWINRASILQRGSDRRAWIYQTGKANFASLAETGR